MSAVHTPGPWRVGKDGSPEHQNEVNLVEGSDGTLIVYGQANDADARLIAAAPDLLEALIEINQHAAGFKTTGMATESFLAWDAKARAAIAKATVNSVKYPPADDTEGGAA